MAAHVLVVDDGRVKKCGYGEQAIELQTLEVAALPYASEPRRRPRWALLALSLAVAGAGLAVPRVAPTTPVSADPTPDLHAAAERISVAIARAVGGAQMRAEGIAATPVLRAAIETDAATLQDLVRSERLFRVDGSESVEVFKGAESLVRLPASAHPLRASTGTQLEADGNSLVVTTAMPVVTQNGDSAGLIALRRSCDLSSALAGLPHEVRGATLTGLAQPLVLVAAPAGAVTQVVPIPADATLPALALVAAIDRPVPAARAWPELVRTTCFIVGVLLLAMFGEVALRRRVRA